MQTRVEINDYSVMYFIALPCSKGCIAELLLRAGLIQVSQIHVYILDIYASYKASSPLNASSAIWRFERSNAIKICKGIIFDFHAGPSHILVHAEISRSFQLLCHLARADMRGLPRK